MKILLLEDDHFQAEQIRGALAEAFPDVIIDQVDSELGFYDCIKRIEDSHAETPDIIILDVMVRLTHPSVDMVAAPEEVIREKHYRAGLRCQRFLASRRATKRIKVILYTVLESDDIASEIKLLPPNVTYLRKEKNYEPFIRKVRRLISYHRN